MCQACGRQSVGPISFAKILSKQQLAPDEQLALEQFLREWRDTLNGPQRDVVAAIEAGDLPVSRLDDLRAEVATRFNGYTNEFEIAYVDGTERGASAGRAVAAQRFPIDVSFDVPPRILDEFEITYVDGTERGASAGRAVAAQRFPIDVSFDVPPRILDEFEDWSREATEISMETMTDETANWIYRAQEEGLSIPDIANGVNDDVFEGRLKGYQAERTARTATISSSNAGGHSAFVDADSVVGEEWLATVGDGRTRDSHLAAHGQITAPETTFLTGAGNTARYPGDPNLPMEDLANCRCTSVAVFREDLSPQELATIQAGGRLNT